MEETIEFELPDIGEGIAEGEIVAWHVEDGEHVTEDQTVVTVETDKAVVDIPSPVDGTVRSRLVKEGALIPVGEMMIIFDSDDGSKKSTDAGDSEAATRGETTEANVTASPNEDVAADKTAGQASPDDRVFTSPSVRRLAREMNIDIEVVAEENSGPRVTQRDVLEAASNSADVDEHEASTRSTATASSEHESRLEGHPSGDTESVEAIRKTPRTGMDVDRSSSNSTVGSSEAIDRNRTLAMPATRRRARELDISLNDVPTDETREGEAFVTPLALKSFVTELERVRDEDNLHPETASNRPGRRVPYTGIRRTIGKRMEQSTYTAPQVSHHDTIDASELVEIRQRLKPEAAERGVTLTYLPFVMKACVGALKSYPILNAELDEENGEIIKKHYYNFGVATDTDAGLIVPIVKDVDRKNLLEIARDVQDVVERARNRSISREEMMDGTFTVTNIGGIGGKFGTPILNYPEVGILALGSLEERPRVVNSKVVSRHVLPISLTSDHRVVDGGDAARFTNELKRYLEKPSLFLLE